jgi:AcrR family transcriptional regulator
MSVNTAIKTIESFHEHDDRVDTAPSLVTKPAARKSGRPRSSESRDSILEASRKLLLHTSVREVSIEAIAKRAGVGKTTIYRWWPNKIAVVLDSILEKDMPAIDIVSGGSAEDMLVRALERFLKFMRGRTGQIVAGIFAEAQGNEEMLEVFQRHFMMNNIEILSNIVDQGKESGAFRTSIDTEMVVNMIFGTVFYRLMTKNQSLNPEFADHLVMEALKLVKA